MIDQMILPAILDACCGPRMMWFDRSDRRALFIDKRQESHVPMTKGERRQNIVIAPDIVADFRALPFADGSFYMVVLDPPHLPHNHDRGQGIMSKTYGQLPNDWQAMMTLGFKECFRVLRPNGVLIFKWNEKKFSIGSVLSLTDAKPLFGHRSGTFTHWYVFMKEPFISAKGENHGA